MSRKEISIQQLSSHGAWIWSFLNVVEGFDLVPVPHNWNNGSREIAGSSSFLVKILFFFSPEEKRF